MPPVGYRVWDWQLTLSIAPRLLEAFVVTLGAVVLGMALALVLGLLLAVGRRSHRAPLSRACGAFVQFVRCTPLLIQLYFLYFVLLDELGLPLGPFAAGVLGLGIHYSSYLSEVFRAGIEDVPRGQWEAAVALDLSRTQTYRYVILPQAVVRVIPAIGNYLIAMFKDTPLLSAITVVEVLRQAQLIGKETFRYLEPITLVGLLYLVASVASGALVRKLEQRYSPHGHGAPRPQRLSV
jgi:polar amino acid transport system permease protein